MRSISAALALAALLLAAVAAPAAAKQPPGCDTFTEPRFYTFYVRGVDPTAIADVTLAGINIPIRIGGATVLPGDVMLGTPTGVIFIPPHLVQEVVETSEAIRVRDEFGKMRLDEGKYTSGEIDVSPWREDIEADFNVWKKANDK